MDWAWATEATPAKATTAKVVAAARGETVVNINLAPSKQTRHHLDLELHVVGALPQVQAQHGDFMLGKRAHA